MSSVHSDFAPFRGARCLVQATALLSMLMSAGCHDDRASSAYSLGGTVTGLTGAGLVLAQGGQLLDVNAGATNFIFGSGLPSGSSYAVTVQTQPSQQTCAVTNGSGTIASTNVANVAITCSQSAFSVGGSISGLMGSGLVLASGSNNTVAVAANATSFTLPAPIAAGGNYAVTVATQPSGQTCTVANGSGTIASANVANVVVTCSQSAFGISGSISGLNGTGLVLANGSGNTVSVLANATTFSLPTAVANGSSYALTVATQPAGLVCAVSNGSGTISGAAVTNVSVTCSDQPFSLGGSISGLTAGGLVLVNGTDVLPVSSGATTFTMPTGVRYLSAYAISVQTQPSGLTCSVSHGSGTMPASAVTTVAVVCSAQSYTLGGTISGLTSGGLVLANGSDTLSVSSGAATFMMPTSVAYGSTYSVTVQTQPTGLTCSVSGGSGAMPAGAVSSVVVSCAATAYTVGGSISYLTTGGLVLANGSDTLSVAANATQFTMPTSVAYGAPYAVTVQTQPTGQTCTVSNGSGTVGAGNVSSIQVTCNSYSFTTVGAGTWTVPAGVTSIQVVATGAGGAGGTASANSGSGGNGGAGDVVTVTLTVNSGDTISYYVGGGAPVNVYTGYTGTPHSGGAGGGGGGSTNVIDGTNAATLIIAGGGGGGGGGGDAGSTGGNGGPAGLTGSNGDNAGSYDGGTGGAAGVGNSGDTGGAGGGGGNGKNGNGGDGGSGAGNSAGVGGLGSYAGAGGGGGGYGGGGGGTGAAGASDDSAGGGGGGGGGSTAPGGAVYSLATNGGAGGTSITLNGASGGNGSIAITIL
jgi:hypothetical protein